MSFTVTTRVAMAHLRAASAQPASLAPPERDVTRQPDHHLGGQRRSLTGSLYEDGGRGKWAIRSSSAGWSAGCILAAGDERVQVERPQPRSGEDDDLDARGTGGTMGAPMNRSG